MSKKFLVSLDLNKNELLNARLQNLSSDPSSPVAGQIYYNTQDKVTKFYDGTNWIAGGSTKFGLAANRPAASKGGTLYAATDTNTLFLDNGTSWIQIGLNSQDLSDAINALTTDDIEEGSSNKYFTEQRARDSVSDGNGLSYNPFTGVFSASIGNGLEFGAGAEIQIDRTTVDAWYDAAGTAATEAGYVATDLSNHINDTSAHGVTGDVVGTSDSQVLTNKTINDELYFTNPSTQPNDGGIKINDSNENFEIRAYVADLSLHSNNGDIRLDADGQVYVDSQLNVSGNLNTTNVVGSTLNSADGSLTLKDGNQDSQIHINGSTKNIELLPDASAKAFYGSAATAGNEIARISDIQASSSGLSWKEAVNLFYDDATPTLSGDSVTTPLVIDGHAALGLSDAGYRILVANGDDAGIYVYNQSGTSWTLTRATDADTYSELIGAAVFVMEGTQYGSTSWVQASHYITNFTGQSWIQFSGQGTYIGSDSILVDGNQINVIVDNTRGMEIDGDGLYIKTGNGIEFDGSGNISINVGTGFDVSSGSLEFASSYGVRKYTSTIGNNSATSFTINHAFGTRHVTVQLFEAASPYAQVEADVEHTDINNVTIKFASAPTTGEFEVVIVG